MFTFIFLLALGALALWFERRLTEAENRRLICRHETEADGFKHTALRILSDRSRLESRHVALAAEIKSLRGSLDFHSRRVSYFVSKHVEPATPTRLL